MHDVRRNAACLLVQQIGFLDSDSRLEQIRVVKLLYLFSSELGKPIRAALWIAISVGGSLHLAARLPGVEHVAANE